MGESVLAEITLPLRIDQCDAGKELSFPPNMKRDDDCLRSKRFQSSYCAKVGARVSFPLQNIKISQSLAQFKTMHDDEKTSNKL